MLENFPGFFGQIKSNILVPTKVVKKLSIAIAAGCNLAIFGIPALDRRRRGKGIYEHGLVAFCIMDCARIILTLSMGKSYISEWF